MFATSPAVAADWPAQRTAYADSPAYDPDAGTSPQVAAMDSALDRQDYRLAASLAEQVLARDPVSVRAHVAAGTAYAALGDTARAAGHREAAAALLRAILQSGAGTRASPLRVIGEGEVVAVLRAGHLHLRGETMETADGRAIEVVRVKHVPDGRLSEMCFDVSSAFRREVRKASGPS